MESQESLNIQGGGRVRVKVMQPKNDSTGHCWHQMEGGQPQAKENRWPLEA